MRALQAIIFAVILFCVAGCGKYILKSEVIENYILKEEVLKNYILKSEVIENYIPKSEVRTIRASIEDDHKCQLWINSEEYIEFCAKKCPIHPYIRDAGIPCP